MACGQCGTTIRGDYYVQRVLDLSGRWTPRKHCDNCGRAYPWTEAKVRTACDLIDELEELSASQRTKLKRSVEELMQETPSAELSTLRVKKVFVKLSKLGGESLRGVLVDVLSDAAKKTLGL